MNITRYRPSGGEQRAISQGRAARALGVTREHLNYVLRGRRKSRRLMRLYERLVTLSQKRNKESK
jgi:hypothetical protein